MSNGGVSLSPVKTGLAQSTPLLWSAAGDWCASKRNWDSAGGWRSIQAVSREHSDVSADTPAAAFARGGETCKGICQIHPSPPFLLHPPSWTKKTLPSWSLSRELQGKGYFYFSCILIVCRGNDSCWMNRKERRFGAWHYPKAFLGCAVNPWMAVL